MSEFRLAQPAMPDFSSSQPSVAECLTLLKDRATTTRAQRVEAIKRLNKARTEGTLPQLMMSLLDCLQHELEPEVVYQAVGVLGQCNAYSAVSPLIDVALAVGVDLFEQTHPSKEAANRFLNSDAVVRLRCQAVRALGRLKDDRAIIALMGLLNDRTLNYRIRLDAAEALGRLGDKQAVAPLLEVLQDEREASLYLKESTIKALGMLGDIRALDALVEVLETKKGFRQKMQFVMEKALEALARLGQPQERQVQESLLKAAEDEAVSIRLAAVEAMVELNDALYLPTLHDRLMDNNMEVANTALVGVYKLAGLGALKALLQQEELPQFLRHEIETFLAEEDPPSEGLSEEPASD